jgi:hypothetical protein
MTVPRFVSASGARGWGVVGLVLRAASAATPTPTPAPPPTSQVSAAAHVQPFWEQFITSAGFGGLMAVVGALVAARFAYVQFVHTKSQQKEDRWWDTLTWVYDRTVVADADREPLPQRVTFAMLTVLYDEAQGADAAEEKRDRLRGDTISALLAAFQPGGEPAEPTASVRLENTAEAATQPAAQQESDVQAAKQHDASRVAADAGAQAEGFEDAVAASLFNELREELRVRGFWDAPRTNLGAQWAAAVESELIALWPGQVSQPRGDAHPVDFVLEGDHGRVVVDLLYRTRPLGIDDALRWAERITRSPWFPAAAQGGAVLVTNMPIARSAHGAVRDKYERVQLAQWSPGSKPSSLAAPVLIAYGPDDRAGTNPV